MASERHSEAVTSNRPAAPSRRHLSIRNGSCGNSGGRNRLEDLADPVSSARTVGLRYVGDQMPGIRREHAGKSFRFRYPTGDIIHDEQVLGRIRSLAIPPAWQKVWICPDPAGHLQATGLDDRKRKQYRYHRRWREVREETKYTRMIAFGKALPKIRARVEHDLSLHGLNRQRILATVVRLLELSLIRVGNEEYERENESYGLTTLKNRHVDVHGSEISFHFRGKSGKQHRIDVRDRKLAQIVRRCQDLPGQELFEYVDENGKVQDVKSTDVNEYLKEITGEDFTAKDFRTWAGTMLAALALQEFEKFDSKTQAKKNVIKAVDSVAARLGNTPSICRKCYVHPVVLEGYLDGTLAKAFSKRVKKLSGNLHPLGPEEAAVLALLQRRLVAQEKQNRLLQDPLNVGSEVPKPKSEGRKKAEFRCPKAEPN
jgi:DNA topoisomerase-1